MGKEGEGGTALPFPAKGEGKKTTRAEVAFGGRKAMD